MTKKPWKEPTLEDLLADPILDLLLARDRVSREELLAVVERARQSLATAARNRLCRLQEPVRSEFQPPQPAGKNTAACLIH